MMTLFLCLRLHDKGSNFEAYLIKIFQKLPPDIW